MANKFYPFSQYLKNKFGERVHRVSINAGFKCPNLDGALSADGCIYCNNKAFGIYANADKLVEDQINESIKFYRERFGVKKFIAYFQSFSNTYADTKILKKRYDIIRRFPEIVGLAISTRPDCIDQEKIELISQYQKDYLVWVEYGLQTTHNRLLNSINRNHTYEDFLTAVKLSRDYEINVGAHVILGLPNATRDQMEEDAQRLAKLDIQGIKFHVLHVLKGTRLESMYQRNEIKLLERDAYIKILCDFLEIIPSSMIILRLISTAFKDYLIAPKWINDKNEVIKQLNREFDTRKTYQGYRNERAYCKS